MGWQVLARPARATLSGGATSCGGGAKRRKGKGSSAASEALNRITTFLPNESQWQDDERNIFFGTHKLGYMERLRIGSFLLGNGCDKDDIYRALEPRLGNDGNRKQLRSWLDDLQKKPEVRARDYYFDLDKQDYYYQDGRVNYDRQPPQPLVRLHNEWEVQVARIKREQDRYPCRAEREAFLRQHDEEALAVTPSSPMKRASERDAGGGGKRRKTLADAEPSDEPTFEELDELLAAASQSSESQDSAEMAEALKDWEADLEVRHA